MLMFGSQLRGVGMECNLMHIGMKSTRVTASNGARVCGSLESFMDMYIATGAMQIASIGDLIDDQDGSIACDVIRFGWKLVKPRRSNNSNKSTGPTRRLSHPIRLKQMSHPIRLNRTLQNMSRPIRLNRFFEVHSKSVLFSLFSF